MLYRLCVGALRIIKSHFYSKLIFYFCFSKKMDTTPVPLKLGTLQSFKVAKVHKENTNIINALDYDDAGGLLLSSSDDESIRVYSCNSGK